MVRRSSTDNPRKRRYVVDIRGNAGVAKTINTFKQDPKAQQGLLITAKRELEEAESKKKTNKQLIRHDLAAREKIGRSKATDDEVLLEEVQLSLDAAICHK